MGPSSTVIGYYLEVFSNTFPCFTGTHFYVITSYPFADLKQIMNGN